MHQDTKPGRQSEEQITRITTRELAHAKDAAGLMLEEIGLSAYIFEVEPRNGLWQVRVDYGAGGVWQSLTLSVNAAELIDAFTDNATRRTLVERWREALNVGGYPSN